MTQPVDVTFLGLDVIADVLVAVRLVEIAYPVLQTGAVHARREALHHLVEDLRGLPVRLLDFRRAKPRQKVRVMSCR